jgi:tetratricopeptide (TPR) repeat protein
MKKYILLLAVSAVLSALPHNVFTQKKLAGMFPETEQSATVKKAYKKLESNDISGALKILDEAIEKKQDLYEVYRERSTIRRRYNNDVDGAIADLDKVLEIKPDDVNSYISLAFLKQVKKDYSGALKIYETAQKYQPDSLEIYIQKAFVKSKLNDFPGAEAEIQSAVKSNPDSIYLQMRISDLMMTNKKPDQAIAGLQSFLDNYIKKNNGVLPKLKGERIKKDKTVQLPGGSSENKVRRYSQMEFSANSPEDLKKQQDKIENTRNLAKAYVALGKLYIARDNFDKAFINFDMALTIDKNQEDAYGMRGILYLSKGEYEQAILELTNAADIADEPYFYLNRGVAYFLTKNAQKSQADFDYFLKLYPEGKAILEKRTAEAKQILNGNSTQPK